MTEFTAKSGVKVVINIAPWADAKRLKAAIQKEAAEGGFKFDTEADISTLISTLLRVDSSDAVDAALWPCLARCTRDGVKIVPTTFDPAEPRLDYYGIVTQCIMENCRPLVEGLKSVLPPSLLAAFPAPIRPPSSPKSP